MDQMPEELLYAQLAVHFLQNAARQLHSHSSSSPEATPERRPAAPQPAAHSRRLTSINFVLSSLMLVRRLAKTALLAQPAAAAAGGNPSSRAAAKDDVPGPAESLATLQERVAAVLDKLRAGGHLPAGSKLPQVDDIQKYKHSLQDAVRKEEADLEAFWHQHRPQGDCNRLNLARLTRAVRQLRSIERGLSHQARVAAEVDGLCSRSNYTDDNFAYGTTPYATWHQVMLQDAVAAKLVPGCKYMVWGASLGWLLFYAAATFPVQCVGYELLESLARVSEQVAKENAFDNVHTVCQDLLASSLADVSVLLLTNQCWDEDLAEACAHKVAMELPTGAVCIEYTGALQKVLGPPCSCIVSPVSWNPNQKLFTYIKQSA